MDGRSQEPGWLSSHRFPSIRGGSSHSAGALSSAAGASGSASPEKEVMALKPKPSLVSVLKMSVPDQDPETNGSSAASFDNDTLAMTACADAIASPSSSLFAPSSSLSTPSSSLSSSVSQISTPPPLTSYGDGLRSLTSSSTPGNYPSVTPQFLSNLTWALARLKLRDEDILRRVEALFPSVEPRANAQVRSERQIAWIWRCLLENLHM